MSPLGLQTRHVRTDNPTQIVARLDVSGTVGTSYWYLQVHRRADRCGDGIAVQPGSLVRPEHGKVDVSGSLIEYRRRPSRSFQPHHASYTIILAGAHSTFLLAAVARPRGIYYHLIDDMNAR